MDSLLLPAESVVEDEMRRNVFWLAYAADRTTGIGHGWAFGIDDEDVGQFLPVRGDLFDSGVRLDAYRPSPLTNSVSRTFLRQPSVSGHTRKMFFLYTQWISATRSASTSKERS